MGDCGQGRRSIPACAGEPTVLLRSDGGEEVYPRVCGGTGVRSVISAMPGGLSPRVRGNPGVVLIRTGAQRSIPACAGEPRHPGRQDAAGRVYPRVCGGTRGRYLDITGAHGLSPRVRGNRSPAAVHRPALRSIPACAGEPGVGDKRVDAGGVYPRVCGGTPQQSHRKPEPEGLSPRVRGNLRCPEVDVQCQGSIPACAGEPFP